MRHKPEHWYNVVSAWSSRHGRQASRSGEDLASFADPWDLQASPPPELEKPQQAAIKSKSPQPKDSEVVHPTKAAPKAVSKKKAVPGKEAAAKSHDALPPLPSAVPAPEGSH